MAAEVPTRSGPGTRGPDTGPTGAGLAGTGLASTGLSSTGRKRDGSRSSLVWDVLTEAIAAQAEQAGRAALDIVDVGAGTGGFAVSIAGLGHRVTVVDPSPDALAAARWRAAEAGVTLTDLQGEAVDLPALVGEPSADEPMTGEPGAGEPGTGKHSTDKHSTDEHRAAEAGADLVICHNVLEYVDSPAAALTAVARVLRPGGTVSVLAANTVAAVLQRALAGKYAEARAMLPGGTGSPGPAPGGPAAARRFTLPELTALIEEAGLRVGDAHGVRVFSSLLPGAGADPVAAEALRELEEAAATCPPLRDIAARLHVLAYRPRLPGLTRSRTLRSGPVNEVASWGTPRTPRCGPAARGPGL